MFSAIGPLLVVALASRAVPSTHGTCTEADFDRDGVIDRYEAVEDSCGTGGCQYRMYLANRKFLGTIEGRCSFELKPRPGKLADIVATWRLGAVENMVTTYRFIGRRYKAIKHRRVSTREE